MLEAPSCLMGERNGSKGSNLDEDAGGGGGGDDYDGDVCLYSFPQLLFMHVSLL
jgi:hypothetical protein